MPLLNKHNITDFLILDEGDYFLLRVELDDSVLKDLTSDCQELVDKTSDFNQITLTTWSPEQDARDRIQSARKKAEDEMHISFSGIPQRGWKVDKYDSSNNRWIVDSEAS